MFQSPRKLLLALYFILMCSLVLTEGSTTYKCGSDRPSLDSCTNQTTTPVCGYYKKNCPFEICGLPTYNGCAACSDPNVLYYKKGDCKPEEVVQTCSAGMCEGLPEEEQNVYEPVCGLSKGGSKTFENYCKACSNSKYPWYQAGVCPCDRHNCGKTRPTHCSTRYNPVCAHFSTDDFQNAYTTVSNGCEACSDSSVDYYTKGKCGTLRNEETYCLPHNRPDICTMEYNPVCGFYKDKDGNLEHKILGNPCAACSDHEVIYHIPGPCVFKCDRNPNVIYDCAGTFEPVCGQYTENGQTKKVSLRNSCIGCYYSGKPIDTYTDGLCPGDKGIRCENDAGAFMEGILHPVCAYDKEVCKRNSCRKTFAEPILACSDSHTIWYSSGHCPEDKGVPCDGYRTKPTNSDGSFTGDFTYANVCGYTKHSKKTYTDQYEACGHHAVLYFREGPCSK